MILFLSLILLLHLIFLLNSIQEDEHQQEPSDWPSISIWVAARNEEDNIHSCLESLAELDYPKEKLQILIGDDNSTDATAAIIQKYISDKPWFQYIKIEGQLGHAEKKANVLAHLEHQSIGNYFLFCDADIRVKPSWAKSLISEFSEEIAVVSATTIIDNSRWFFRMQRLDWLYSMGLMKSAANIRIPCTAVGNNMAVSREAYFATGGYEAIPVSITEDYMLFKQIISKGYSWKHKMDAPSTSVSAAAPDFNILMQQRKRWLNGGKDLPMYWKVLLLLFGLFDPVVILLLFFHPAWALYFIFVRFLVQSISIFLSSKKTGIRFSVMDTLAYAGYSFVITAATGLFFPFTKGREWKGRRY